MKRLLFILFLGINSNLFAQYSKITDRLNSYNPLRMVRMTSSSFLVKHNYQLEKDEQFLDKLIVHEKLSKGLSKDIAKKISKNTWPSWIKDGVDESEEPIFNQMVGVLLSNYYSYSNDAIIAFHPELNFQLPVKYKFEEAFYFKVDNKYHFDEINPKTDNQATINQNNIAQWHEVLLKKYPFAKPLQWKAKSDWISYNKSQTVGGNDFIRNSLSLLEACRIVKGTNINPYYLYDYSMDKNFPMGISFIDTGDLNSLKIIELISEISGYSYDFKNDKHLIEKTIFYYIPENTNKQLKGKVALSPYKGLFGKFKVLYPLGDPALQYDKIDIAKLKKPATNYHTEFTIPPSKSGKISFLIQDYVNKFQNFGKGGIISEKPEGKIREIYWYDQIGEYGTDTLFVNAKTGKLSYWAYMTPYKDSGWSYRQCMDIYRDLYYLFSGHNHFAGMEGFSVTRKPQILVEGEKELKGAEAVVGKYVSQLYFAHSTNFDSQYAYDREVAGKYVYNLRVRIIIKPLDEKKDQYFVYLYFYEI